MKQVPAPPQLSLNFDRAEVPCTAGGISNTQSREGRTSAPKILDISPALRQKQEAQDRTLYRRILDSIKHLG